MVMVWGRQCLFRDKPPVSVQGRIAIHWETTVLPHKTVLKARSEDCQGYGRQKLLVALVPIVRPTLQKPAETLYSDDRLPTRENRKASGPDT
jgi:hypothetical protein